MRLAAVVAAQPMAAAWLAEWVNSVSWSCRTVTGSVVLSASLMPLTVLEMSLAQAGGATISPKVWI